MADADLLVALGFAATGRVVVLAAGLLLLWLRPADRAKRLLGLALCLTALAGITDAGFVLGFPGGPRAWFFLNVVALSVAALLIYTFLSIYPRPVPWRSTAGVAHAAIIAYAIVAPFVVIATYDQMPDAMARLFGYYSPAYGVLGMASVLLSLERARDMPEPERSAARRMIVATGALAFVFIGYTLVADPATALGIPHHQRYGEGEPIVVDALYLFQRIVLGVAYVGIVVFRHKERLPLVVGSLGILALLLDQFSRYNIIDFGIANLVLPLVAMHAATRHGAFGVRKVPSRMGIAVSVLTGASVCILVAAIVTLSAGQQPFFLIVGSFAGLVMGAVVAYQIRPRGVGLAIYRHPEEQAPPRALTATRVAPGALIAGRYQVDRVMGEGGEGSAFLARDEVLARDVVLKVIRGAGRAAVHEARVIAMFEHAHIVRVYDVLETAQETVLVLELAEGGSLRGLLSRQGALPRERAAQLADDMLAGLEAAHARGVVHGDVKPENVLLTADGRAKLADFGIARLSPAPGKGATVREAGSGTLAYMSPEQARGHPATAQSDLYAVGLCYHEMVTGRRPRDATGLDDLQLRTLVAAGGPAIEVAQPALARFFERALAREPSARFEDAASMRAALASVRGA